MNQITVKGQKIEDESFTIVDREAGPHEFTKEQWEVVRRVIHSTADFDFKDNMCFSDDAIDAGVDAFSSACPVIVDVKMIAAGLSEKKLSPAGSKVHHFISDEDVIRNANEGNTTRAVEAMRKAHSLGLLNGAIVAIGNAPTALLEVIRLAKEENARPALIIGVPVGFVSAEESKETVMETGVPYIVARGRKGGTPIAVATAHALLTVMGRRKG